MSEGTWECPKCDYSIVLSYEQLAELCGFPMCEDCDTDLELQDQGK